MVNETKIKEETKQIVRWLVACDYDAIEKYTNSVRLPADELKYAVGDYGREIVMPPDENFDELDIIKVENAREWSVRCSLWTKEEGRSDLTLELSLIEISDEGFQVEIDNLIVL